MIRPESLSWLFFVWSFFGFLQALSQEPVCQKRAQEVCFFGRLYRKRNVFLLFLLKRNGVSTNACIFFNKVRSRFEEKFRSLYDFFQIFFAFDGFQQISQSILCMMYPTPDSD